MVFQPNPHQTSVISLNHPTKSGHTFHRSKCSKLRLGKSRERRCQRHTSLQSRCKKKWRFFFRCSKPQAAEDAEECLSIFSISYNYYIIEFISNFQVSILYRTCAIPGCPFFLGQRLHPWLHPFSQWFHRSQEDGPIKVCNRKEEHHDETVEGPADGTWRRDCWMTSRCLVVGSGTVIETEVWAIHVYGKTYSFF